MVYCSAYNCNNDGKKKKSLSFFQFPSDEKYCQIWKEKVIDFNSLLDDYLKALQSEEELCSANSTVIKIGSDELVDEIIPRSSLARVVINLCCFLTSHYLQTLMLGIRCSVSVLEVEMLFLLRYGKEQTMRGEYIPRSETPGVVVAQLETSDGKVLGSTKFIYKDEISTGFRKIVCSKNYGGKLVKALSSIGTMKDPAQSNQTKTDAVSLPPPESSLALASILKLMLYVAAKHDAGEFVEDLFRTNVGKGSYQFIQGRGGTERRCYTINFAARTGFLP
ncbi:hypothetical protein OS493_025691 [Desmophyllum pertusum]|uniref:THAP-type domain-containing protein n=1 Tax=Desmophyllum pertusum TaxID=174260 RepID=A0A9X0D3T6_9CNID|nr:hypothetical protein OS493_025691 [Desmophyllum pertusum]